MEQDRYLRARKQVYRRASEKEFLEKHERTRKLSRAASISSRGTTDTKLDQEKKKIMRNAKISQCAPIKRSKVQEVNLEESETGRGNLKETRKRAN